MLSINLQPIGMISLVYVVTNLCTIIHWGCIWRNVMFHSYCFPNLCICIVLLYFSVLLTGHIYAHKLQWNFMCTTQYVFEVSTFLLSLLWVLFLRIIIWIHTAISVVQNTHITYLEVTLSFLCVHTFFGFTTFFVTDSLRSSSSSPCP